MRALPDLTVDRRPMTSRREAIDVAVAFLPAP